MGQLLHGSARTTAAVRRAIQHSQESLAKLAACMTSIPRLSRNGRNGRMCMMRRWGRNSRIPRY
jgi:hypothetical protein